VHTFHRPYGTYGHTATEMFEFSADAKRVRRFLEDTFIRDGRGPTPVGIAAALDLSQSATWDALWELERGVQVMFVPGTEDIVKVPPFSNLPTRHRVEVDGEQRWYAGCAGESCAINGLFPGRTVTIHSTCPDCWEPVEVVTRDRQLISVSPDTALMHWGVHARRFTDDWIVTCDSINFFRSPEHVAAWETAVPERRGITMSVALGIATVEDIATQRYWNYDRGPDLAQAESLISRYRGLGVDVGAWET
jgi:hypothetical protein